MMKRGFSLVCFVLLVLPVQAQWQKIDAAFDDIGQPVIPVALTVDQDYTYALLLVGPPFHLRIYRTADNGDTWTHLTNFVSEGRVTDDVFGSFDGRLIAGGISGDLSQVVMLYSDDQGENWAEVTIPGAGQPSALAKTPGGYFMGTTNVMLRSTDDGQTWQELPNAPIGVTRLVATGNTIFSNTALGNLRRSTDNGETWEDVLLDPNQIAVFNLVTSVWSIGNTTYVKGNGGAIFSSTDDGRTWVPQPTFDVTQFLSVAISPSGGTWVPNSAGQTMFLSQDQGATATNIITADYPTNILNFPCLSFPTLSNSHIFIVASCFNDDTGIYRYQYGGDTSTSTERPERLLLSLEAPYPNPMQDAATIHYTLDEAAPIHVALYNMLGREVAMLRQGVQPAGTYSLLIKEPHLTPGTYWIRMTAGAHQATQALHVIR